MGISYNVIVKGKGLAFVSITAGEHGDFRNEVESFGNVPDVVSRFLDTHEGEFTSEECRTIRDWMFENITKISLNWKFQHYADLIVALNTAISEGEGLSVW